jgi:hypothetical protein
MYCQSTLMGSCGIHDHFVGIDTVQCLKPLAKFLTALALFPFFKCFAQCASIDRANIQFQQSQFTQVQHNFRYTTCQEDLNSAKANRAIGDHIHKARGLSVDALPVFHGRAWKFCGMCNGGDVQQ